MLQNRNNLDHAQVVEKLVVILLALTVLNQVRSEHKDGCGEDWQDFERFEAKDAIP